jgi:nucleotide-binding universal stress UspA family protein
MYKRILIATDGSDLARKGLDHGLALAQRLDADVTIVVVTEPTLPVATSTSMGWAPTLDPAAFEEAKAASAKHVLEEAARVAEAAGARFTTLHIRDRFPAEGIVDAARDGGCDLIVIASHGRRGVERLLLGSQTTEVLTHSHIPVLVVK